MDGIVRGLHAAGHQVTLMSFGKPNASPTPLDQVCERIITVPAPQRSRSERIQTLLLSNQADIAARFYSQHFEVELLKLLQSQSFDLIQFEAIEIACYLPVVREHVPQARLVFDTFNAEAELQRVIFDIDRAEVRRWPIALYSWIQSQRINAYEGQLCRLADAVIAVSEEDHAILSEYRKDDRTFIVPSGIFVERYTTAMEAISLPEHALVFTGKMDYRPNVDAMLWFADEILPHVPQAHLTIVGQKPHPRIQHLPQRDNIALTGWVDSVPPYLHAADVYVAPLRMGGGTRLKILEAMASGCAIIATTIAAAGLNDDVKSALIIVDDPSDFARAVTDLLQNPARRAQMGQLARARVRAHYDWSVLIPRLTAIYEEIGLG